MNYSYAENDVSGRPVQQAKTPNKSGFGLHDVVEPDVNRSGAPVNNKLMKNESYKSGMILENGNNGKNGQPSSLTDSGKEWPDLTEQIADWIEEEYGIAESVIDYPAVTQVVVEVFPNPEAIWNFCVAYTASAMARRQEPSERITIASGDIGVYYFAAVTLFYSIEEASAGRIPPIQMLSKEVRDLFYACAPTNKLNRAWVVNWEDYDLLSLINSLPYNSYQNPDITLAPFSGGEDPLGRPLLDETSYNITFPDLNEIGPQAFEIVQRYLLGSFGNTKLFPYTEDGDTTNIAMFAFSRDPNAVNPVDGFRQVVLEAPMRQRDLAYYSLNFFGDKNGRRDGWSPRTVQISTIPMMNLIMNGYRKVPVGLKYQVHMINFQSVLLNFLVEAVSAVFNSREDRTIGEVASLLSLEDGYLDTMTAGQIITAVLQFVSRRYCMYSAWAAGTVLPEENCKVIGAGSAYMTFQYVDNYHTFLPLIEQLAGASAFLDVMDEIFLCPVLMKRGNSQTLDYTTLGGSDLMYVLALLYPQLGGLGMSYPMKTPGVTDLPDTIVLDSTAGICYTAGTSPRGAGDALNAVVSSLQAYCAIGAAVGSRDGSFHKGLYLTHYLDDELDGMGFDITVLQQVTAVLTTCPITSKAIATSLSCYAPVMYGPKNANLLGAYQVLYSRNNSIRVDEIYSSYRASREVADGHKRAANINAPDEYGAHISHQTYVGAGGAFFAMLAKAGKVVDTGSKLFGRVLDLVAPEAAKKINPYINAGRSGVKKLLNEQPQMTVHFNPVSHNLVHPETLFLAVEHLERNGEFNFSRHTSKVINTRGKGKMPHVRKIGSLNNNNNSKRKGAKGKNTNKNDSGRRKGGSRRK